MHPPTVASLGPAAVRCMRCRRRLAEGEEPARWFWCSGDRQPEPLPGDLPPWSGSDRYTLRAVLGRGGAGQVFLADRSHEPPVAIKMLAGSATKNPRTQQRFAREIRVASSLDDPGVVRVIDGDADADGEAWVAMELVQGPSLREVIADGPLPVDEALRIGIALARTLARLHDQGIAHRDVKPSNILLSREGQPLLTDFGLVALLAEDARRRLTTHAVGTPAYMAPELVREPLGEHDGTKVDQFALALLIEESVTGRLVDRTALEGSLVEGPYPLLAAVLAKAHHPDPAARFRRMTDLADDLERARAGAPVQARPPGLSYHAQRALRRHRAALLGAAASIVAVAAIAWGADAAWTWQAESAAMDRLEVMEGRARELREAGRNDEARAVFDAFVTLPENQGRDALAQAWLAQGRRDLEGPTYGPAMDSLSRAFVASVDPVTRDQSASALDRTLREAGRFRAAYTLRQQFPEAVDPVDPVALMMEAGDMERVLDVLPPEDRVAQLVGRLQRATELPARVKLTGDLDGDGRDDDMFLEDPHPLGMPLDGFDVRDVMESRLMPLHGSRFWLRTTTDGGVWERHDDGSFHPRCRFDAQGHIPGAVRDGEVWLLAQQHHRAVLRIDLATCVQTRPFPTLDAMGSYPLSMDLADLDGDGVDEAVVSIGPPNGHGVFVLRQTPAGWVEQADIRLGYVPIVHVVPTAHGPRIVANAAHFHPNPVLFPEPPHLGVPAGQYVLRWDADGLTVVEELPSRRVLDSHDHQWVTTWFGHVDDDGLEDIVTSDGYVFLSTSEAATPFQRVPTGFDALDFIVDIDADGQVELGATHDDRTLILGLGDPRPAPPPAPPVTSAGEPALDQAQALERIGLTRYAGEAYARIGRGRSDALATDALVRAAALLGDDHPEAAAEAAEEAAARGRTEQVAVAVDRYLEVLRADDAQRVLRAHGGSLPPEERSRLEQDVAALLDHTVLRSPPDGARWGELVRWTDAGLQVETVTGAGPLLRIPLRQTGEVVGFRVVLSTDTMEFASELDLHLANGAGQPLSFQLVQRERGGTPYRFAGEVGWGKELELSGWRQPTTFDIRVQELPDSSWVAIELRSGGELLERARVPRNRGADATWVLELSAPEEAGLFGQMATVDIQHLEVTGLVPDPRDLSFRDLPPDAAAHDLATSPTGRPLLHRRLRRDPMLFREYLDTLGPELAYPLAAEAFAGLADDALGLLPMVAELDPALLAETSPELATIRAELLCQVGREQAGRAGLAALGPGDRCQALRQYRACFPEPPPDCEQGTP